MTEQQVPIERSVWRILHRRASPLLEPPPTSEEHVDEAMKQFLEVKPSHRFYGLIKAWPGSGMSRDITDFMTEAWGEGKEKGLYLMLSHAAIKERLKHIEEDGNAAV